MDNDLVRRFAAELHGRLPGNVLTAEMGGIDDELLGTALFDAPLVGFAAADDPLFADCKRTEVVGPWHASPREWLPGAQSVVSFFFPMSADVRSSNRAAEGAASTLWTCARIEGQAFIRAYLTEFVSWLESRGVRACAPSTDPRFKMIIAGEGIGGYPELSRESYGSTWSERHVAYICGLGTFGLSKGIITECGTAGRLGSIVVDAPMAVSARPYSEPYEYCIMCGACIPRCPVEAIDAETGKDHAACSARIQESKILHRPRYGCGLCQTRVPCESRNPSTIKPAL